MSTHIAPKKQAATEALGNQGIHFARDACDTTSHADAKGSQRWYCLQNFVALIPLALVLGEVTEDLATRFGDVIGGLLNATFGNVVELILSVAALTKGLYTVVAMSLIGSILSNLLLVMGKSCAAWEFQYQHDKGMNS